MAPTGGRLQAQLLIFGTHHLTSAMTDRQVFMQRVDDRRQWQRVPRLANQVVPEEEGMLEMNDVGLVCQQKFAKMSCVRRLVRRGHVEEIKITGPRLPEVLIG